VGCGVCDTPELWRGAVGLCARVRTCAGAAESLHTYIYIHTFGLVLVLLVLRIRIRIALSWSVGVLDGELDGSLSLCIDIAARVASR